MPVIIGVGTDIVAVARLRRATGRFGARFAERILTPGEMVTYRARGGSDVFLASRFAAKEAAAKALGTGFRDGVTLQDIEVVRVPEQRPELRFHHRVAEYHRELGAPGAHLSLSDEQDYAVAFVVLER